MFNVEVRKYFDEEIKRRELNKTNKSAFDPIHVWKESWREKWSTELFCDLSATFTLGPAYIWSNIHMCTKMSWEVYKIPTFQKSSHPPGEARMKTILHGLELIGFKKEKDEIQAKWNEFKKIIDYKKPSEFPVAVPEKLLKRAAEFCLVGIKQIGCEIITPASTGKVCSLLNDSWKQFWINPEEFYEWEKKTVADFKASL